MYRSELEVPVVLDRLADRADYAIIGPHDGRIRVADTKISPYNAVCHVERDFGTGVLAGCSGFLVKPRVVLTAGHCVYSHQRKKIGSAPIPVRIRITPGKSDAIHAPPFGSLWATHWYAHPRYIAKGPADLDFGVILLPRAFAKVTRVFRMDAPSDRTLQTLRQKRLLHVAGYPSDKPRGTQWTHWERLDRFTNHRLFYSVDTCPGHSGSPIWVTPGTTGDRRVIGIHTAGPKPHAGGSWGCKAGVPVAPAGMLNSGVRLTADILRDVDAIAQGSTRHRLKTLA